MSTTLSRPFKLNTICAEACRTRSNNWASWHTLSPLMLTYSTIL